MGYRFNKDKRNSNNSSFNKGRNKAGRGPKNVDAATYAIATGFETIVGWLFLKNPNRLADLFDLLDRPIN